MSNNGFIPFGEPADTTDEGRAILASLTDKEREVFNITSRALYGGRNLDALDLLRLKTMWRGIQSERREQERRANPTPGTCWQCGSPTGGTSSECRPCHEGMTPGQYAHTVGKLFMTPAGRLPTWMH